MSNLGDEIFYFRQPGDFFLCQPNSQARYKISDLGQQGYDFPDNWICIPEPRTFSTRYGTSSSSQYSAGNPLLHLPEIPPQSHCTHILKNIVENVVYLHEKTFFNCLDWSRISICTYTSISENISKSQILMHFDVYYPHPSYVSY